jgi:hypothetical protein
LVVPHFQDFLLFPDIPALAFEDPQQCVVQIEEISLLLCGFHMGVGIMLKEY